MAGATFFLRCGTCKTLYRAEEGFNFRTGESVPCWFKPKKIRKPVICDHAASAQAWNGTEWIEADIKRSTE